MILVRTMTATLNRAIPPAAISHFCDVESKSPAVIAESSCRTIIQRQYFPLQQGGELMNYTNGGALELGTGGMAPSQVRMHGQQVNKSSQPWAPLLASGPCASLAVVGDRCIIIKGPSTQKRPSVWANKRPSDSSEDKRSRAILNQARQSNNLLNKCHGGPIPSCPSGRVYVPARSCVQLRLLRPSLAMTTRASTAGEFPKVPTPLSSHWLTLAKARGCSPTLSNCLFQDRDSLESERRLRRLHAARTSLSQHRPLVRNDWPQGGLPLSNPLADTLIIYRRSGVSLPTLQHWSKSEARPCAVA
ncbi:hypothetical protein B0T22DRAFT_220166 [Podospora appendiculata]|uniref:Uncharacterized protein n=1 Tax=Podospora appendiculata TaxID=314037 RepID=A0AAE1CAG0_9PEZI|nr:hypothetical protein B0T22DRAFT_220166 [Podospora appendiculata]